MELSLYVEWFKTCLCVCPSEALQKEKVTREEQRLQELDEEEYDSLPEEQKERITQRHREKVRLQKLRYSLEDGVAHWASCKDPNLLLS